MDDRSPVSLSVEDLHKVLRVLKATSGHLHSRELYQSIVDAIPRELGSFHIVNLALVFPGTARLVTVAVSGDDAQRIAEAYGGLVTQPIDKGIMGWVVTNGRSYYAPDAAGDPLYYSGYNLSPRKGSELALPVKVDGEVVAVLNLESRMEDAFSPPMIGMLEVVADHIGEGIQNALLHEQALADAERLRGAFERLRVTEAAFAAVLSAVARTAWIVDAKGRIEARIEADGGRVAFHAASTDTLQEELSEASRAAWEAALARVARGEAVEAEVSGRDGARPAGRIRLYLVAGAPGDGRRVLVLA